MSFKLPSDYGNTEKKEMDMLKIFPFVEVSVMTPKQLLCFYRTKPR